MVTSLLLTIQASATKKAFFCFFPTKFIFFLKGYLLLLKPSCLFMQLPSKQSMFMFVLLHLFISQLLVLLVMGQNQINKWHNCHIVSPDTHEHTLVISPPPPHNYTLHTQHSYTDLILIPHYYVVQQM